MMHDGSQVLTDQVLGLRTVPGAEGIRIRSQGRLHAVKRVVWAPVLGQLRKPQRSSSSRPSL